MLEPPGEPGVVRRRVRVTGVVQGVFFRDSTRREAVRHGVGGWVRNLPDGRVEAAFEGAPRAVTALVEWCRIGPPLARVERIELTEEAPEGASGFAVLRDREP